MSYEHPADAAERRRRIDQSAADLRAANTWMRAEVEAMNAAKWQARFYGAMTVATWTLCAAVWVAIGVIAVDVIR